MQTEPEPTPDKQSATQRLREQQEKKVMAFKLKLYLERLRIYQAGGTPPEFIPCEFLGS